MPCDANAQVPQSAREHNAMRGRPASFREIANLANRRHPDALATAEATPAVLPELPAVTGTLTELD